MRTLTLSLCSALLAFAIAGSAHARSLRAQLADSSETVGIASGSAFDALADVLADSAARALPVVSASAGITYRYNTQLEVFERSSETLGPIFMERPDTLGQHKFNVNVSYQYVQFDAYDGQSLKNLQSADPIVLRQLQNGVTAGFTANSLQYRLRLQNYVTAFSFTYGVLDNLDVNLLLPLIATTFDVGVTNQQLFTAGPDAVFSPLSGDPINGRTTGDAFGVGDILLRLKYQFVEEGPVFAAAGLQLRMPSGDEADFHGTGSFEASPSIYLSSVLWNRVTPYFNAAIDLQADDVAQSQARYSLGFDVDVTRRLGLAFAFLGRSEFSDSASPSETAFQHLTPQGNIALQPLLGLDFSRNDMFDFSFGFRAVVWRQVMVFANGIFALNGAGLRNDTVIPTIGVEGTF